MNNGFFESNEFREILSSYKQFLGGDSTAYLDADDFADVADYYLSCDDVAKAKEAVENGLAQFPEDEVLLTVNIATYIYEHRFRAARKCMEQYGLESNDNFYQKAQLCYALDNDIETADKMFREWMAIELENMEEGDKGELERDSYMHIISSYVELGKNPLESKDELAMIRTWVDEYIDKFQPLGRYETDLTVMDVCRNNNLSDLLVKGLTQVLEEQPYLKGGWATLGLAYYTLDQHEQAIEACDFALAIDEHDVSAMLTRAYSHSSLNQREEACKYFSLYMAEPGIEQMQGIPFADNLARLNRNEEANKYLDLGISSLLEEYEGHMFGSDDYSKRYSQALFDASTVYQVLERYEDAERCMTYILDIDPHNSEALFVKGSMLLAQKKSTEALECYGNAINKAEDYVAMAIDVALTLVMNSYEDLALEMINAIDKLNGSLPQTSFNSGSIKNLSAVKAFTYLKLGDTENFLRNLKLAMETTPELLKNVLKGYFPDTLDVQHYYDYALMKISKQ